MRHTAKYIHYRHYLFLDQMLINDELFINLCLSGITVTNYQEYWLLATRYEYEYGGNIMSRIKYCNSCK